MRRLVALVVLSLLGAAFYGLSNSASGIRVNDTTLSGATFRAELSAIAGNTNLQCHLAALNPINYSPGAGGATISATGASAWANLRVEGLAIVQFVRAKFSFHPNAASEAQATTSLENELTQAALSRRYSCPGTAAQALASMPAEMRRAEVEAQDASVFLLSQLNSAIALNPASLQAYYGAHRSSYDTICVSVALVPATSFAAFRASQSVGMSVANLAKKYSTDRSSARGGRYGCYGPTSSSYRVVRADTVSTGLNRFPLIPLRANSGAGLFVAPTRRSVTPFAVAESAVLSDVQNSNASKATSIKSSILYAAAIAVDPAYGRWGLASTGPGVFIPSTPATPLVGSNATLRALSTPSAATYK